MPNGVYLPTEPSHHLAPVSPVHIEPDVRAEEAPDVTLLDLAGVLLGIDNPHTALCDREVVDVPPSLRNAPVVENNRLVAKSRVKDLRNSFLSDCSCPHALVL